MCNPVETGSDKARSYDGDYMQLGKTGEARVIEWLKSYPGVIGVDDFTQLKQMQKADVDCGIYMRDGRVMLAEIKTDSYLGKTENILFEVLRINHTCDTDYSGTLGWSFRSPAKWLLYYAINIDTVYRITFDNFRKGMQAYTKTERKNTNISYVTTDSIKSTVNILVPEVYFEGLSKHKIGKDTP